MWFNLFWNLELKIFNIIEFVFGIDLILIKLKNGSLNEKYMK